MNQPYGLASPNNKIIDGSSAAAELTRDRIPSNDIAFWCATNFIALSGTRSGLRPARILPELNSSIAQRATRRIRPPAIEQHALNRIGRSCLDEALLVVCMIRGFRRSQKTGANPGAGSAKHEGRRQPASVSNSTSGEHWRPACRINNKRHQDHGRDPTPDVAACLIALGHNRIDAKFDRSARLIRRSDAMYYHRARGLRAIYISRWIAPEE
ncbi:hypothetical protein XH80_18950 [Bradyrhizobium sp. CCBAU 45384]|nr:hypothetical protein [Bradyrhizobium sp. CCBAU 45384]